MWEVSFATDLEDKPLGKSRLDYYGKNHPAAVAKMRQRLDRILECLNNGISQADALSFGWVHPEKQGVFAIDPMPGFQSLRLYCALVPDVGRIVIFTIGEKKRQQEDIQTVLEWKSKL